MENKLVPWINEELESRGWTMRELARRSGVSHAAISLVLSEQQRPTFEFCEKIARGLGEPPEKIFRIAGLLPRLTNDQEVAEQVLHYLEQMPPEQQRQYLLIGWVMAAENRELGDDALPAGFPRPA